MIINTNILASELSSLSQVGPKTVSALATHGINSIFQLLLRPPKSIITQNESLGFRFMQAGRYYIAKGEVKASKVSGFGPKKRLEVIVEDKTGCISLIFFGPAVNYVQTKLTPQKIVTISGEAKDFLGRVQMVHPKILNEDLDIIEKQESNYSQIAGISPSLFKKIVDKALSKLSTNNNLDHLSEDLLKNNHLSPLYPSLLKIHQPDNKNGCNFDNKTSCNFFRRVAFEELLSFYVPMFKNQKKDNFIRSLVIKTQSINKLASEILPFELTLAQVQVLEEIILDMSLNKPMLRLLQGDVGCGKTAVSAIAALHVVTSNNQVALMAPTEILARQLYEVYLNFFESKTHIKIALLTSSTSNKERSQITKELSEGSINILIGTHALLSNDIIFKSLGLFVIDEQHRFGVNQRASLLKSCKDRQDFYPHLLVMSATPIPRSLALTIYHDLDLSVITQRPQGRLPIETKIFSGPVLKSLNKICERIIASNQKAFIVFPLVEESETLDLENATKAYLEIKTTFGENSCLMVHGQMKPKEKDLAMQSFKDSNANFLVATSVIEVGVDIPQASVMIIVHPERFGLAQLHQLRGRVGRGKLKSFCFLLTDIENKFSSSYKRLEALCKTQDGFALAQADLEHRGPGEILGTKQSGLPNFNIFNYKDFASLVPLAKSYAKEIVNNNITQDHAHLLSKDINFS